MLLRLGRPGLPRRAAERSGHRCRGLPPRQQVTVALLVDALLQIPPSWLFQRSQQRVTPPVNSVLSPAHVRCPGTQLRAPAFPAPGGYPSSGGDPHSSSSRGAGKTPVLGAGPMLGRAMLPSHRVERDRRGGWCCCAQRQR